MTGSSTPKDNVFGNATLKITLKDQGDQTITYNKFIDITAVNDAAIGNNGNVSLPAGLTRHVTVNDFGYYDIENDAFNEVVIDVRNLAQKSNGVDVEMGSFFKSTVSFEINNATDLEITPATNSNNILLNKEDIEQGKIYFKSNPGAFGTSADFQFQVYDINTTADIDADLTVQHRMRQR